VADSETSAVRAVGLKTDEVKTLVGKHLFDFGDKEGDREKARLQHALAVAWHAGNVYVADTYNNKLKRIDAGGLVTTYLGDLKPGRQDNPPRFDEPGGLAVAAGKLYVADTNNHAIRVVDLATKQVSTLALAGLEPPPEPKRPEVVDDPAWTVKAPAMKVAAQGPWKVDGKLPIPADAKLNAQAAPRYQAWLIDAAGKETPLATGTLPVAADFAFELPGRAAAGSTLRVRVSYVTCQAGSEGVCRRAHRAWRIPLDPSPTGPKEIPLPVK
jgi:hypothetical protein